MCTTNYTTKGPIAALVPLVHNTHPLVVGGFFSKESRSILNDLPHQSSSSVCLQRGPIWREGERDEKRGEKGGGRETKEDGMGTKLERDSQGYSTRYTHKQ